MMSSFCTRIGLLVAVCLLGGCIDTGRQCGPHQDLTIENVCVCKPGAVVATTAYGACVPCGANQVVLAGRCECVEGFVAGAGGVCEPKPPGLGDVCNPAASTCASPFTTCQPTATSGYCTKSGCAAAADCPSGFGCDTSVAGGVCVRAPSGQGKTCAGEADCAGTDATFCAPVINSCLVLDCSVTKPGACFPGYLCCDLTALGLAKTACLPGKACP